MFSSSVDSTNMTIVPCLKKWFEVKGQICMDYFPQDFARQLHNPINVVTLAHIWLYSGQKTVHICVKEFVYVHSSGQYYSHNYSFLWSLDWSISRQCVQGIEGHTNIHPTLHQAIKVISKCGYTQATHVQLDTTRKYPQCVLCITGIIYIPYCIYIFSPPQSMPWLRGKK